jgi:diguanylate cyclase (GGDEF)-like protein
MPRIDARLREMQFLAQLDRDGPIEISGQYDMDEIEHRQMLVSLMLDGYVNGIDTYPVQHNQRFWTPMEAVRQAPGNRDRDIGLLLTKGVNLQVTVRISHKGRVRLSELQQQLKSGRDRDDTGLLWRKRHLAVDLTIDVLSASKETPLSVAFLDMNGLGAINNIHGHDAGDQAIHAFFQTVVATLGERGEVYRNGGDEVVVIMPNVTDDGAIRLFAIFVQQLGKDVLILGDAKVTTTLTASCGSASATEPNDDAAAFLKRADAAQYRAKSESKKHTPRVSTFAVGDGKVSTYAPGRDV